MTDYTHMRRAPILDGRLSAAMALAGQPKLFADIGADHGRLSVVMLLADPKRRALVADVSAAALSKAQARISWMGLTDRAVFAVADGLDALDSLFGEIPDVVFILGMGGDTVSSILRRGGAKLQGASLILGAQTELPLVREALCDIGYFISDEVVANENRRDYILIRAEKSSVSVDYTEEELLLGPVLLKNYPEGWLPILQRRERLLLQGLRAMEKAPAAKDAERYGLFQREVEYVQNALRHYQKEEETL